MSWTSRLNALIVEGQAARMAESSEALSQLLALTPQERWGALLARDARLERLLPEDYQRLLLITMEPRGEPFQSGPPVVVPLLPEPHLPNLPPPAEPQQRQVRAQRRLSWLVVLLLVSMAGLLVALWLRPEPETGVWNRVDQRLVDLAKTVEANTNRPLPISPTVNVSHRDDKARLIERRAFLTLRAVEQLAMRLELGAPYRAELTSLQALWANGAELTPLESAANLGVPGRPVLAEQLATLEDELASHRRELQPYWRWLPFWSVSGATLEKIQSFQDMEGRVASARQSLRGGDLRAASLALAPVQYPKARIWRQLAETRLALEQTVTSLSQQAWVAVGQAIGDGRP